MAQQRKYKRLITLNEKYFSFKENFFSFKENFFSFNENFFSFKENKFSLNVDRRVKNPHKMRIVARLASSYDAQEERVPLVGVCI